MASKSFLISKSGWMTVAVAVAVLLVIAQTEFVDYFNGRKKLTN